MKKTPYFTVWQIAQKWSVEQQRTPAELVMMLKPYLTYLEDPPLVAWPAAIVSPDGEISLARYVGKTRMQADGTTLLFNKEMIAATDLLNSCELLDSGDLLERALSKFVVRRADFERWCQAAGFALPRFWFSSDDGDKSSHGKALKFTQNDKSGHNERLRLAEAWASEIISLITKRPSDYQRHTGLVHVWAVDDFLNEQRDQQMVLPYLTPKSKERDQLLSAVKSRLTGYRVHQGKPPKR